MSTQKAAAPPTNITLIHNNSNRPAVFFQSGKSVEVPAGESVTTNINLPSDNYRGCRAHTINGECSIGDHGWKVWIQWDGGRPSVLLDAAGVNFTLTVKADGDLEAAQA